MLLLVQPALHHLPCQGGQGEVIVFKNSYAYSYLQTVKRGGGAAGDIVVNALGRRKVNKLVNYLTEG